jgi:endonuclease/exonuclease/phosphatase family metal-dependent hydrolase
VILSKAKPALFKLLKLTDNSNKYALIAKFNVATNSLRRFERVLFVNVHLSSNKAKNFNEKRKIQLETLKRYLVDQIDEFDLEADHYFLCGDFNFGDLAENQEECALMRELFEKNGFADLVRNANTFEPNRNFSAAVTAFNPQGRRLDRILYRSESSNIIELIDSYLVNTAPFKIDIDPVNPVLYQPYLSVASYTKQNRIKIDLSENAE